MTFDDWCKAHGLFLNDPDDAAVAARAMAFAAWERATAVECQRCAAVARKHTTHPDHPSNEVWQCAYNHVAGEIAAAIERGA